MNYIGSKLTLLPFLESSIKEVAGNDLSQKVFCDIFAGSATVGRIFKTTVNKVIANDCEYYSYILNRNYIGNNTAYPNLNEIIAHLNNMPLIDNGFIYNNYCLGGNGERQYFSDFNGKKIDTIRTQIEEWKSSKQICEDVYYFLLCSLIECADQLANTASVYGSYLKRLKKTAQKKLVLEPALYDITDTQHAVYQMDANELVKHVSGDILYLDPPYNRRQYGANYHILNTIAEYKTFIPRGKTGLPAYARSRYCHSRKVLGELEKLIRDAQFKYLFLSYNNEGLMSIENLQKVMQKYGRYSLVERKHQRFKADSNNNRNHFANYTIEYLHILEKN